MPPLPPFASIAEAYDASLSLLSDSLARTHAAGGLGGLRSQDRFLLNVLHSELVRTCAALINKGWRSCPVSRDALIEWSRHAVEAREVLAGGSPAAAPPLSADARIEADGSRRVPGRFRSVEPVRAPVFGARRTLKSLLGGLPALQLRGLSLNLLRGWAPQKADTVRQLNDALLGDDGLARARSMLSGDAHALLQRLLAAGGELPLAGLSRGLGPLWQHSGPEPVTPLALLQSRGLVFMGWDQVQQDVLVVVPAELRRLLAPPPWRRDTPSPPLIELHVELSDLVPAIWRRVRLPGTATLFDLHYAIQAAFGWRNMHLHTFRDAVDPGGSGVGSRGMPGGREADGPGEAEVFVAEALPAVGARLLYWYDFGDDWVHVVERVAPTADSLQGPRLLVDGERAGPPEDCGGLPGYDHCVAVATGRERDPGLKHWLQGWHPEAFDLHAAQRRFRR